MKRYEAIDGWDVVIAPTSSLTLFLAQLRTLKQAEGRKRRLQGIYVLIRHGKELKQRIEWIDAEEFLRSDGKSRNTMEYT